MAAGCEWREAAERRKLYAWLLIAPDYGVEWPGALSQPLGNYTEPECYCIRLICVCARAHALGLHVAPACRRSVLRSDGGTKCLFFGKRLCVVPSASA